MNKEETRLILNTLRVNYPQSYRNMNAEEKQALLNLWCKAFENIPYKFVEEAVYGIISTDIREFAPNIAQVKREIAKKLTPDLDVTATYQWERVRYFMQTSVGDRNIDMKSDAWKDLDHVTKRIYPYRTLRNMATTPNINWDYKRSEFMRIYIELSLKRNRQLLEDGDLVELAGGKERFITLGYSTEDVERMIEYRRIKWCSEPARNVSGLIGGTNEAN